MTNKDKINEATSASISSGKFQQPMVPGVRMFNKQEMQPYYIPTSKYDDAELAFDSYDGKMSTPKNQIKKKESQSRKISKYIKNHPTENDDDGNNINSGNGPSKPLNKMKKENIDRIIHNILKEDLAVWFGTKKKPKGSTQPKGPWVNICRKKEGGGHPPCGRPEASDKGYPKCRAAGVASKMTDSQKKSACQQKRTAEKSEPKTGTGNKPTMVSYKPKKKTNENKLINLFKKILLEQVDGQTYDKKDLLPLLDKNGYTTVMGSMNLKMGKDGNYQVFSSVGKTQSAAQSMSYQKAKNPLMKFEYIKGLENGNIEFLIIVPVKSS
jgi:hypothetical protein